MKVCNKKSVTKRCAVTKRPAAACTKKRAAVTKGRQRRRCGGRCMKPGPIVRNPYLNFLRKFRKENCGLSPIETIRQGARAWKSLTVTQRLNYIKEAFYAPKRRRNMQCKLVCKKKPPCGIGQRKRSGRKRSGLKRSRVKRLSRKRRSRKPKASCSKPSQSRSKPKPSPCTSPSPPKARRSRSKAKTCSKPRPCPSKSRKRSSKPRPQKAGFTC